MWNRLKNKIAALLAAALLTGLFSCAACADAEMRRVVLGADLNEEQIAKVYLSFGFPRGEVPELRLSNAEERAALSGYVADAVIGTKAISCVYLELLPQGSGMDVKSENISWCTPDMYTNALTTGGISDARVKVAAPFSVSGTAALAGIYKAYEDMTGKKLDELAKDVSTQELTITGELANQIGSEDSTSIVNELKQILGETVNMSDDEVRGVIRKIAEGYQVRLTDTQVEQLLDLVRALEKLDTGALTKRVEGLQNTLEKVGDAKDQVVGFLQSMKRAFETLKELLDRISGFFDGR